MDLYATFENNEFVGNRSKLDEVLLCSGIIITTVFVHRYPTYKLITLQLDKTKVFISK